MTRLLEQAFASVSTRLSHQEQDRLAQLMVDNLDSLREMMEDAQDERTFEACAQEAVASDRVRSLLQKAAERHGSAPGRDAR